MIIQSVWCALIRFKCPGCGKTVTFYPDFALPHKHYTRQTIMGMASTYLESDVTYKQALMTEREVPGYADSDAILAASSIHRWITSLARCPHTCRSALALLMQESPTAPICRDLAQWHPPARKFRSQRRRQQLIKARRLAMIEAFFQDTFNISIFTKLAIACGFG
jgi:hypothetical protein